MAANPKSALEEAQRAFAEKFQHLLDREQLSQAALGRALKARKARVAAKTLSNIGEARHPSQVNNFAAIADYFGVPLWIMFVPGLKFELLDKDKSDRLIKLMADYIACSDDDRKDVEKLASRYRK